MRKSGFTLIELIFVIVIIGVLAATAIPKFKDLKQNAEANNVVKLVTDAESAIPASYINKVDLEEETVTEINATIEIKGKGWTLETSNTEYIYTDPTDATGTIASITLDTTNRTVTTVIDCDEFNDAKSKKKCNKAIGLAETSTTAKTTTIDF